MGTVNIIYYNESLNVVVFVTADGKQHLINNIN